MDAADSRMTPKAWRQVRIVPDGRRYKIVTFYTFIDITDGGARALGFESAQDFVKLTKKQAMRVGQELEDALWAQCTGRRTKHIETNVLQKSEASFKLHS